MYARSCQIFLGALICSAARGLLDWTQIELVAATDVGLGMLRFRSGPLPPDQMNLFAVQRALEAVGLEFLPDGGVRLHPERITSGPDYNVDRYKFRLIASRNERDVTVDIPREIVDDAAHATPVSTAQRRASFEEWRPVFEARATDVLRSQAREVRRVCIDNLTFEEWRKRHRKLADQDNEHRIPLS